MQATIIVPIVALFALVMKQVFGIELGETEQAQIADGILAISLGAVALIGVLSKHNKKKEPQFDRLPK